MSLQRLAGRVCIVTGSSSGIGRAVSLAYAREGGVIVCADLRQTARPELQEEAKITTDGLVRQNGGKAVFVQTDVTKTEDVQRMVKAAVEEYGKIDVLVNSAGISLEAGSQNPKVHETPESWYDKTMDVNVRSIFLTTKYVAGQMLKQPKYETGDRGWIINLSSIYGLVGGFGNCTYAASKGAVSNFTRTTALDYAEDGIHCNALCPGYTETAIWADTSKTANVDALRKKHPLHGTGKPSDIAGAAVFLASDEARWVTGVSLAVDGGYTAQ